MGCRQCLHLSVVQLKGKHCRKPHCRNGVVDTFGPRRLHIIICLVAGIGIVLVRVLLVIKKHEYAKVKTKHPVSTWVPRETRGLNNLVLHT